MTDIDCDKNSKPIVILLTGIIYAAAVLVFIKFYSVDTMPFKGLSIFAFLVLGVFVAGLSQKSVPLKFDIFNMCILTWLFFHNCGNSFLPVLFLPLVTAVLISCSFSTPARWLICVIWPFLTLWLFFAFILGQSIFNWPFAISLAVSMTMLLIHTLTMFAKVKSKIQVIDFILCSYSGNTYHFSNLFIEEARKSGVEIRLHRFHKHKEFIADLTGDAIAISFPVIGWKPPWPFFNYLLLKLPRGKGRPAIILQTCAGGPENAGLLTWLLLTINGYRVMGYNWGLYPINVPTIRLGREKWWKFLDSLLPPKAVIDEQKTAAENFINGKPAGIPFFFSPTPLFIVGILIDNFLIDTLFYHNHIFKKRCVKCGLCVKYCPTQRLKMKNGFPYSRGSCAICMACVNICPHKAMHIWMFTEYGNPYEPKCRDAVESVCSKKAD